MGQGCTRSALTQNSEPTENTTTDGIYMPIRRDESRPRSLSSTREAGVSSAFTPASIALWERQHKKKWEEDVIPSQTEDPCDTSVVSREASALDNLTPLGHLHKQSRMVGAPPSPSSEVGQGRLVPVFAPEGSGAVDAPDRWQQAPPGTITHPLSMITTRSL